MGPNVRGIVLNPPARHPILSTLWNQYSVYRQLKKDKPDTYWSPDGFFPLKSKVAVLAVIHDIAHQVFRGNVSRADQVYYDHFIPKMVSQSDHIMTVSQFTKDEMVRILKVDPNKISVAYNAPREAFVPLEADQKDLVKTKWTAGHPYLIYVGSIHPRKNVARLIKAFDQMKKEGGDDHYLVLASRFAWQYRDVQEAIAVSPYRDEIIVTGYLQDEDLAGLLGAATVLTNISIYEGFGLPLVEAMACEVPIICTNGNALGEVAADAGLKVDPLNTEDIAKAMQLLIHDDSIRAKLIAAGNRRLKAFSWEETARATYASLSNL
jgi:glycosyltransferase involved in cell wall biosynthesis